jgi:hypothetical protein
MIFGRQLFFDALIFRLFFSPLKVSHTIFLLILAFFCKFPFVFSLKEFQQMISQVDEHFDEETQDQKTINDVYHIELTA